jgi:thioesterase domain-containing protein
MEADPSDSWVFKVQASGSNPPLFCACAGGGDVREYAYFSNSLQADQPIYIFGLPPAERSNFPSVEQIASTYLRKVREIQPRGPYRLCGHSFGGLVVYEMARRLKTAGEEVAFLALIDALHPQFSRNLSLGMRTMYYYDYLVSRVKKYFKNAARLEIKSLGEDLLQLARYRIKHLIWEVARGALKKSGRRIPEAVQSDAWLLTTAWKRFDPEPYAGRVVLFNACQRPAELERDRTLGWRVCVKGELKVYVVPGDHYSMMRPPNVSVMTAYIRSHLATPPAASPAS